MKLHRTSKSMIAVAAAVAALAGASIAQAMPEPGFGTSTPPAVRALHLRGEALNARYGLGGPTAAERALRLRSEALNALYGPTAPGRALRLRGEALNARYAQSQQASSTTSRWIPAGLGLAALLLAGLVVIGRKTRTAATA